MRCSIFNFDYILLESLTHQVHIEYACLEFFVFLFMNVGYLWEETCIQGETEHKGIDIKCGSQGRVTGSFYPFVYI
jgi:hypothetical protein